MRFSTLPTGPFSRSGCRDISWRARGVYAEVRVGRLAAGPDRSVASHQVGGTRVEALRPAYAARRQSPRRVGVDRGQRRAAGGHGQVP